MKSIKHLLKSTFCNPVEPKDSMKAPTYKQLKHEYLFSCYLLLSFSVIQILDWAFFSQFALKDFTIFILSIMGFLMLLHLNKILFIKMIFAFFITGLTTLTIIFDSSEREWILFAPTFCIINPILCSIITRNSITSIICYIANSWMTTTLIEPLILKKLQFNELSSEGHLLKIYTQGCIKYGLLMTFLSIILMFHKDKMYRKMKEKNDKNKNITKKMINLEKEAKTIIEDKINYFLTVSHELKNSLNNIIDNIESILKNLTEERLKINIQNTKASAEILLFLLNNFLDAGKMQKNCLEVNLVSVQIKTFIEKMWGITKVLMEKKNLTGEVYLAKDIPDTLSIDPHRLLQIMLNLIGNSSKYTQGGSIKVIFSWIESTEINEKVLEPTNIFKKNIFYASPSCNNIEVQTLKQNSESLFSQLSSMDENQVKSVVRIFRAKTTPFSSNIDSILVKFFKLNLNKTTFNQIDNEVMTKKYFNKSSLDNGILKIEVIDTGCGISEENLQKIFTKFSQIGDDVLQKNLGTGLGLLIVKQLCNKLNGDVRVFSEENQGSTFVIALKCNTTIDQSTIETNQMAAMIVDDDKTNQEMVKKFLHKCGVHVTDIADDGLAALKIYRRRGPNFFTFVLMDLEMPVMNGKTSAMKIREFETQKGWNPVHLVIISGNYIPTEIDECLAENGRIRADFFFEKPFKFDKCANWIKNYKYKLQKSKKVLIVDDNIFNLKILSDFLETINVNFSIVCNGMEALNYIKINASTTKLILMDAEIAIMDSFMVSNSIFLETKRLPNIPIYGLSANDGDEFKKEMLTIGIKGLLLKPIKLYEVQDILNKLDGH